MPSLQDPREHPARCDPASAQYADLETGGGVEMPVVQERPIRALVHSASMISGRRTATTE